MALKNFRVTNGISIENSGIPTSIIQETVTSNSVTTVDTVALNSFVSCEYTVTLAQGSKVRTSKVFMQTDGTSVDMTEFGIIETGGTISGVAISATTASTNAVLQLTVTDASSTIVRYKIVKNILSSISYISDAPTIGTATAVTYATASITFTEPVDNGAQAISSYTVTSNPTFITASGASSPIVISGLTESTAYTFTVTATNTNGTSLPSSASNSITTPVQPVQVGYFAGGYGSGFAALSGIDKITFPADTKTTLSATLSSARGATAAMANSGVAGYIGGGSGASNISGIDKITFPADTRTTLSATLSSARHGHAAMANSGTAGYFGGGEVSGSTTSNIEKVTFPADTITTLSATLSSAKYQPAAMANSGVAGYIGGGSTTSGIDKITFPADTKTTLSATLTSGRYNFGAMANSGTAGYFGAGNVGSNIRTNNIDKITFPADTKTTLSATLSSNREGHAAMANSGTAGYFAGGWNGASIVDSIDKITFSDDTRTILSATLSSVRQQGAGMANVGTL